MLGQHGLDLAEFDPKTADLDLVVGASEALHAADGVDTSQIARAVQACVAVAQGPRVGQEFFRRELGAAQVAGSHAGAGDT